MELRILTHGGWGMDMMRGVEMIIGETAGVEAIGLDPQMTLEEYTTAVAQSVEDTEKDYLFLTDLFGGTTTNVALKIGRTRDIDVICGVNAPLLVELALAVQHNQPIDIEQLLETGHQGLRAPSLEMKERMGNE